MNGLELDLDGEGIESISAGSARPLSALVKLMSNCNTQGSMERESKIYDRFVQSVSSRTTQSYDIDIVTAFAKK